MYKIQVRHSVDGTIKYFLREPNLSASERQGVWMGTGVQELGMVPGPAGHPTAAASESTPEPRKIVVETDLRDVLRGYAPWCADWRHRGRALNARYPGPGGNRRCAWDCVISPHKSVSVAALCLPGVGHTDLAALVRSAFDLAIADAVEFMELLTRRNVFRGSDVETYSLLAATFTHLTSRRNDPQLHAHVLVMNTTHDRRGVSARTWYALESLQLYRQAREIDTVFQRELVRHLRAKGINTVMRKVDGLPMAIIPAINPAICRRLSTAHLAIQKQVTWERAGRNLHQKRYENLINDRCRPSKRSPLATRQEVFDRALSEQEAAQVAHNLVSAEAPKGGVGAGNRPPLTNDEMDGLLRRNGSLLGVSIPTPIQISQAAILASAQRQDLPFIPFWVASRLSLGRLRLSEDPTSDDLEYTDSFLHVWHDRAAEELLRRTQAAGVNPPPGTELVHQQSSCIPEESYQPAGSEKCREPADPGSAHGTSVKNSLDPAPPKTLPDSSIYLPPADDSDQHQHHRL